MRIIPITAAASLGIAMLSPVAALASPAAAATGTHATAMAAAAAPVAARNDRTVWLCRPGVRPNPCDTDRTTTVLTKSGSQVVPGRTARKRPVDCFYLYPTVSQQAGAVANLTIDPEEVSIASYQAARFSQVCKVYAPMYRQLTLQGIFGSATAADREIAYASALSGWRSYLKHYNKGRGVVLIGHSQGSGLLRRIIAETVDRRPALRSRLVTAILAGTSVAVKKGTVSGGDFRHVPGCTASGQVGCVTSFATFDETPPDDSFFGVLRARPGTNQPWGGKYEALCTNPASLQGGSAVLRALYPSKPIVGALGAAQDVMFGGDVPTAATPWVSPADRYRARCVRANGAHVLMTRPMGSAPDLIPSPTAQWGLHLVDLNLPLGNLVPVVQRQIVRYAQQTRTPSRPGLG